MMPSLVDLILPHASARIDEALPLVGASEVCGVVESSLGAVLGSGMGGRGAEYLRGVVSALNRPLPRVFVDVWRAYEEFLAFAPGPDKPAGSGEVDLWDHETQAYWALAPRFEGKGIRGPVVVVTLIFRLEAGTVEVRDGRFAALRIGEIGYEGTLRIQDAPRQVARIGPGQHRVPDGRIDFGRGWPIRPRL